MNTNEMNETTSDSDRAYALFAQKPAVKEEKWGACLSGLMASLYGQFIPRRYPDAFGAKTLGTSDRSVVVTFGDERSAMVLEGAAIAEGFEVARVGCAVTISH